MVLRRALSLVQINEVSLPPRNVPESENGPSLCPGIVFHAWGIQCLLQQGPWMSLWQGFWMFYSREGRQELQQRLLVNLGGVENQGSEEANPTQCCGFGQVTHSASFSWTGCETENVYPRASLGLVLQISAILRTFSQISLGFMLSLSGSPCVQSM